MSAAPTARTSAELLFERYSRQVHGFCRARLSSPEEAEDAVQHTFLNAYRSLNKGTVPRSEAAWVFAIAANVCRERLRSSWRRSRVGAASDACLVGEQTAAAASPHAGLGGVADALAGLAPNQRRAILMREWQGLSYKETATELDVTEAAVETLLFRARRSLARKLDRSRAWGLANLGSALAWGKSLLGGGAAQVAAATLAVSVGVGAAVPSFHHATPSVEAAPIAQPATAAPASFVPRQHASVAPTTRHSRARTTQLASHAAPGTASRVAAPGQAHARV